MNNGHLSAHVWEENEPGVLQGAADDVLLILAR